MWKPDSSKESQEERSERLKAAEVRAFQETSAVRYVVSQMFLKQSEMEASNRAVGGQASVSPSFSKESINHESSVVSGGKQDTLGNSNAAISSALADIDSMLTAANSVANCSNHNHTNGMAAGAQKEYKTDDKKSTDTSFSHTEDIIKKLMDISKGKNITK